MSKPSRTTRRAQEILPRENVRVAVPAQPAVDGEVERPTWRETLLNRGAPPQADGVVLAFLDGGTAIMAVKKGNAGIPRALLSRVAATPEVVQADDDGLLLSLDGAEYRVGPLHRKSALAGIQHDHAEPETSMTEAPPSTAPTPQDRVEPEPARTEPAEGPSSVEPNPPTHTPQRAERPRDLGGWAAMFERQMLTDEIPRTPVETRNRTTMQCQRLVRDQHVYVAVPAKARPRPGTEDQKGEFLVAFTDGDPILFSTGRSNRALPRDIIGAIPDSEPVTFEPSDRKARHGGVLSLNGRAFEVPLAYVRSLTEFLEDSAGEASGA